ncbi:MAG: OmpA family protein [Polyangia bacterium]|jgi:chemotaxis protein MotB|nr:OmpA family protein [Polyangia bacterium]
MRSILVATVLHLAGVGALVNSGCCADVERKHNSCVSRLSQAQSSLRAEQSRGKELARAMADAERDLQRAREQNDFLSKRLTALGQQVSEVRSLTAEERAALTKQLQTTREQLDELRRREAQAHKRVEALRALLEKFKSLIQSGKIRVTIRDGRMVVVLSSQVLFDSGQTVIKPDGKKALGEITQVLRSVTDRKFQVAGHTDNAPIRGGRYRSNWELSTARAVAVVALMQQLGMPAHQLSAAGYSQFSPVKENDKAENRAENRRIEIVLQPRLDELPDLKTVFE